MKRFSTVLVTLCLVASCGGRQGGGDDAEECDPNLPRDFFENFVRYPVDTSGDCEPDFWRLYEILDDEGEPIPDVTILRDPANYGLLDNRRIRQKWLDLDYDGRRDVVRFYDTHERLVEQQVDVDFDGRIDRVDRFDDGVVNIRESDANRDGAADVTRYYRGGDLHRMEIDSDGDGTPDTWRFYDAGHLLRIGQDTDGDLDIDTWLRRPAAARATPTAADAPGDDADGSGAGEVPEAPSDAWDAD